MPCCTFWFSLGRRICIYLLSFHDTFQLVGSSIPCEDQGFMNNKKGKKKKKGKKVRRGEFTDGSIHEISMCNINIKTVKMQTFSMFI